MNKIKIYCTSLKYYRVIDKLPPYIIPLGLGNNYFPNYWKIEKKGKNILSFNKYYGELTGFYWVWKNQTNNMEDEDLIGFCHYRKLWMNNNNRFKNKFSFKSIYSDLLIDRNSILKKVDVVQVKPIIFKKKNLIKDFEEVHKNKILYKSLDFLNSDDKKNFTMHLQGNVLYPLNMFITKKKFFINYCETIFPWLENCYNYCSVNNLLNGYNLRLPAFLAERFTSYWFSRLSSHTTLNYARLGNFFLNSKFNNYFNTLKIPFTSIIYPTIHRY